MALMHNKGVLAKSPEFCSDHADESRRKKSYGWLSCEKIKYLWDSVLIHDSIKIKMME